MVSGFELFAIRLAFYGSSFEPALIDRSLKREPAPLAICPYGDFETTIATLNDQLAKGPYLLGERFTAVDVLWGNALNWTTAFGLVPISTAVSADIGAIGMESVSKMIGAYWREQASLIGTAQWEIRKWPDAGLLVMTQPHDASGSWLMASLATGAWARGTGLVSSALTQFGVDMYMGSTNGRVYKMETTGFDDAAAYTCRYLGLHEQMGAGWNEKTVEQMRPVLSGSTPVAVQVSANTNFATDTSPPPSVVAYTASGLWDSFVWDVDAWDTSSAAGSITPGWSQVGRTGYVIAPEAQVTIGNAAKPDVELIAIETTIRPGAMVT